jgi:hypothetical protein
MTEKPFKKPAQLADKIIEEGLEISHPALLGASIHDYDSVSLNCELQKWLTQQDNGIWNRWPKNLKNLILFKKFNSQGGRRRGRNSIYPWLF